MTRASPGNGRAVDEARKMASLYRRGGYPDASAAPEYCVDEVGEDGFYTFTVSVFLGKYKPDTMQENWKRIMGKMGLET